LVAALACERQAPPAPEAATATPTVSADPSASAQPAARGSRAAAPATAADSALAALSREEFSRLFHELSEPGEYFFSDNTISNETSYLQVAQTLKQKREPGGAYLGVGPEQNYTYIALTRPRIAFIVDIRRDNALLHLLYKAIFDEAKTRAQFAATLLGRPYESSGDPGVAGDITVVLAHAEKHADDEDHFRTIHRRLVSRILRWGISLSTKDRQRLDVMHRTFFEQQLELTFELHETTGRDYPTLRELLVAQDPEGRRLGFLATRAGFETVQRLHRLNRIVPVVGDFAGTQALQGVATELRRRKLPVSAFYVSNVEQYLFEPAKWTQYVANVLALPTRDDAVFIRCYLDQGRRHPQQLAGHRTATVLQPLSRFVTQHKEGGYRSFWLLATDG
jgi:hypothetical protein